MPGKRDEFVFTSTWYDDLHEIDESSEFNSEYWARMLNFRNEANKAIETARNNGVIGGSLEAELKIYVSDEEAPTDAFKSEVLDCAFSVEKSNAKKCERCWHYEESVDADPEFPGLCKRCVQNVKSTGEIRHFA